MMGISNILFYLRNHFFQLLGNYDCCCVQWNATKLRKHASISKLEFKKCFNLERNKDNRNKNHHPPHFFSFCILLKGTPFFTIVSRAWMMLHGSTSFFSSSTFDFRKERIMEKSTSFVFQNTLSQKCSHT